MYNIYYYYINNIYIYITQDFVYFWIKYCIFLDEIKRFSSKKLVSFVKIANTNYNQLSNAPGKDLRYLCV